MVVKQLPYQQEEIFKTASRKGNRVNFAYLFLAELRGAGAKTTSGEQSTVPCAHTHGPAKQIHDIYCS